MLIEIWTSQYSNGGYLHWKKNSLESANLLAKLSVPMISVYTENEIARFDSEEILKIKGYEGYIPASLTNNRRSKENIISRTAITLDADYIESKEEGDTFIKRVEELGYQYILHSTFSHRRDKPRYRILVLVSRVITPPTYEEIARKLGEKIGLRYFDSKGFGLNQMMFWPVVAKDLTKGYVVKHDLLCKILDPEKFHYEEYGQYGDYEIPIHFPKQERLDPREFDGQIGVFNKTFNIHESIESFFLPYTKSSRGRYSYGEKKGKGLYVTEDALWCFCHQSGDPAGGYWRHAYDLVRIHKFGEGKKSHEDMRRMMGKNSQIAFKLNKHSVAKDYNGIHLELGSTGLPLTIAYNIKQIFKHDPILRDHFRLNYFTGNIDIVNKEKLPFRCSDCVYELELEHIRDYIAIEYRIENLSLVHSTLRVVSDDYGYDPLIEYVDSLAPYDGTFDPPKVMDSLFQFSEPRRLKEEYIKAFFSSLIWKAKRSPCKVDLMLVLISNEEGTGKTTFFKSLMGKNVRWYSSSLGDLRHKDALQQLDGKWLVDTSELTRHTTRYTEDEIKNFFSQESDNYRKTYGKITTDWPRRCVFVGTSNNTSFLMSGQNRRFMCLTVNSGQYARNTQLRTFTQDLKSINMCFSWAVHLYNNGAAPLLPEDIELMQYQFNKRNKVEHPMEGVIHNWLEIPIPKQWKHMNRRDRRLYYETAYTWAEDDLEPRKRCSTREVWELCYNRDLIDMKIRDAAEINSVLRELDRWKFGNYHDSHYGQGFGVQRAVCRTEAEDEDSED